LTCWRRRCASRLGPVVVRSRVDSNRAVAEDLNNVDRTGRHHPHVNTNCRRSLRRHLTESASARRRALYRCKQINKRPYKYSKNNNKLLQHWQRKAATLLQQYSTVQCKLSPRGRRDDLPPPTAVRLEADLRPSADGSAVRTWLSCRQPTCLQPRASARLGLGQTDGRIAVSLNAPPTRPGTLKAFITRTSEALFCGRYRAPI